MKAYPLVACLIAVIAATPSPDCLVTEDVEVEEIEDMETRDLITVPPELMTAEERTRYVNIAYDKAFQGKMITFRNGQTQTIASGTYTWITTAVGPLNYTTPGGRVWTIPTGVPFSTLTPITLNNPNVADIQLTYFPDNNGRGVALTRVENIGGGGFHVLVIEFGGQWTVIEETAAGVFVRSISGYGPESILYAGAAGNILRTSANAYL